MPKKLLFQSKDSLEKVLASLAAIKLFKDHYPDYQVFYKHLEDDQINEVVNLAPFITHVYNKNEDVITTKDVFDLVHTLEASRKTTYATETYMKNIQKDMYTQQREKASKDHNVPIEQIPLPTDWQFLLPEYPHQWWMAHGFAIDIEDKTGLRVIPRYNTVIPDWAPNCGTKLKELSNKWLHKRREVIKPSSPYIFVTNIDDLLDKVGEIDIPSHWECIEADPEDMLLNLGLVGNPRCKLVIGLNDWSIPLARGLGKKVVACVDGAFYRTQPNPWDMCIDNNGSYYDVSNPELIKIFKESIKYYFKKEFDIEW